MEKRKKLSEAILDGCRVTSQGFGRYFTFGPMREDGSHDIVGACALGAALIGATSFAEVSQARMAASDELNRLFPELRQEVPDPLAMDLLDELSGVIADLNDFAHWPREDIAYWLAKQGL